MNSPFMIPRYDPWEKCQPDAGFIVAILVVVTCCQNPGREETPK